MPTMNEIYKNHQIEYNLLVDSEDYENNLEKTLKTITSFENKTICELGMGTGRLTKIISGQLPKKIYGFDREKGMLNFAKKRLGKYGNIEFNIIDNKNINHITGNYDILIEGWSIGHTLIENWEIKDEIINNIINWSNNHINKDGKIIFIETLGSSVDTPSPPGEKLKEIYSIFENKYGFKKSIVRTDYKFNSNDEAQNVFGFFFGDWIIESIKSCKSNIIKEFTGIWYKEINLTTAST